MRGSESVEEYCGGVCCEEKRARPWVARGERERESKQINKDKSRLMAVQEKV
jgi:hypothetical protein